MLAVYKWFYNPLLREVILVTGAWCIYNLYLALVSLGAFWERKQIRSFHRINVSDEISVSFPRLNYTTKAVLTDMSLTGLGFKVQVPHPLVAQERVIIEASHSSAYDMDGRSYQFEAKLMRFFPHEGGYQCGSEFMLDNGKYTEAVSYVYGDSERWMELWDQKAAAGGTYKMLWYFFMMGIKGTGLSAAMFINQMVALRLKYLKDFSFRLLPRKISEAVSSIKGI